MHKKIINRATLEQLLRILLFFGMLAVLYFVWLQRGKITALSRYGYAGVFLINFISSATIFLPLPGVATVFLTGALWNPLLVGLSAGLGAGIGELSGYLMGYGGRGLVVAGQEDTNKLVQMLKNFFIRNGFITTFILALIPIPFFDIVGVFAGAMSYPIWKFTLAAITGRIIRDVIIAWSGAEFLRVQQ